MEVTSYLLVIFVIFSRVSIGRGPDQASGGSRSSSDFVLAGREFPHPINVVGVVAIGFVRNHGHTGPPASRFSTACGRPGWGVIYSCAPADFRPAASNFVPRSGAQTLPEFLEMRPGRAHPFHGSRITSVIGMCGIRLL